MTELAPRPRHTRGGRRALPYLIPASAVFGVFLFFPLLAVTALSFTEWNLISPLPRFVGLDNYAELLTSADFGQTLLQTAYYLALAFIGNFLVPVLLAVLTLGAGPKLLACYRTVLFLPAVVSSAVGAIVWQYLYLPDGGPINAALDILGWHGANWLNDPTTVIPAVAAAASWNSFGFNYIVALGGLSGIPAGVREAARLDGAGGWVMLTRITLPMARPTLVFVATAALLQALPHAFVPLQIMTGGGPDNASNNLFFDVYRTAFQFFQIGQSAAGSVVLIALLSAAAILQYRLMDRRSTYDLV
ncbi:sugar ABC transporter permease [Streptomyces sp. NPDC001508]|uniref:carbohydrate ABC transporter permease n=1 Tax=Streptomyces sp. NPDC001508 TaxID=3154656 RepID=UPI00331BE1F0